MPTALGAGYSTVSATPDGGFIVTSQTGLYSIKAQRFDAEGAPVGTWVEVASRALFPGVSHFGGSYGNSPGSWTFTPYGVALFLLVGEAFSSTTTANEKDVF